MNFHNSSFSLHPSSRGAVAQLGERLNGIQEVVGSTPIGSTKNSRDFIKENFWLEGHLKAISPIKALSPKIVRVLSALPHPLDRKLSTEAVFGC